MGAELAHRRRLHYQDARRNGKIQKDRALRVSHSLHPTHPQEKYGANNYAFLPLHDMDTVCYFETESYPMQLMMYIGNDMIESVPLSEERISQPGYLGKFKRMLKDKYADLIREAPAPPEFLVVDIATPSSPSTSERS